jgi:hypothetical protein
MKLQDFVSYHDYPEDFENDLGIPYTLENIPTYVSYLIFRKLDELVQYAEHFDAKFCNQTFTKKTPDLDKKK